MRAQHRLSLAAFIAAVFFSYTAAYADTATTLALEALPGKAENITTVTLCLNTEEAPAMMQLCMSFDPNVAECVSASCGEAFSDNTAPTINVSDGKIYFVWDSLNPLTQDGALLQMDFCCTEETEIAVDSTQEIIMADENFKEIPVAVEAESVLVSPCEAASEAVSQLEDAIQSTGRNSGLTMSESELTLGPGEGGSLTVSENEEMLIWSSSSERVAVVEDGKVTAREPGSAIITVTTEDGQREASCYVTVGENGAGSEQQPEQADETQQAEGSWAKVLLWAGAAAGVLLILIICLRKKKAKA